MNKIENKFALKIALQCEVMCDFLIKITEVFQVVSLSSLRSRILQPSPSTMYCGRAEEYGSGVGK